MQHLRAQPTDLFAETREELKGRKMISAQKPQAVLCAIFMSLILGCSGNSSYPTASEADEAAPAIAKNAAANYYVISKYDPQADAVQDLKNTVERATSEDKRIILVAGGDW